MAEVCQVPIFKSSKAIELSTTPKTLTELGVTLEDDAVQTRVIFEGVWQLVAIGRYARDPAATISATKGNPIWPNGIICLNEFETGAKFQSIAGTVQATVQQFKAVEVCDFTDLYKNLLPQILPVGFAWTAKCVPESNLAKLIAVFSKIFSDLHCRIEDMIREMFLSTCVELCDRHENETFGGQIRECLNRFELTNSQQVLALVAKAISGGAFRADDYVTIGAALGLTIVVDDDPTNFTLTFDIVGADVSPMLACDVACARLFDGPDMNMILAFICIIDKIAPAQSDRAFTIDGGC